jgi:hypothetical protein
MEEIKYHYHSHACFRLTLDHYNLPTTTMVATTVSLSGPI